MASQLSEFITFSQNAATETVTFVEPTDPRVTGQLRAFDLSGPAARRFLYG